MAEFDLEDWKFLRNGVDDLVEYDKQCCLFLERMRLSASFDIVQKFKSFVNEFVGTHHNSEEECSDTIHAFIEDMFVSLSEHSLWRDESHVAWDTATEAAERYLLTKLFKVAYVLPFTTDIADDEHFYRRVRSLQFLKPTHFDIPERPLNRIAIEMAAQELYKADGENMKAPLEKLTSILNCVRILSNLLQHYSSEGGADDLLPYLIFTILFLSPKHMHSNIRYISRFRRQSKMEGEASYYFTQMESAVLFIMDADYRRFSITEEEFTQGIERCESLMRSGLDVSQFVASSSPLSPSPSSSSSSSLFPSPHHFNISTASSNTAIITAGDMATPSPLLARKATVIKEWSNLQRTRALSQSEGTAAPSAASDDLATLFGSITGESGGLPPAAATAGGPPVTAAAASVGGPPSALLPATTGTTGSNTTDSATTGSATPVDQELRSKFITSRFEELTVDELKQLHQAYKFLATSSPQLQQQLQ